MKVLKAIVTLALAAACAFAAVRLVIPRLRCNAEAGRVNAEVRTLDQVRSEAARYGRARANIASCEACLARFPSDYRFLILLGSNLAILGEREEALQAYRRALEIEQRPELYAYIASLQVEMGDPQGARETLMRGALFNLNVTLAVDEPMRSEVYQAVLDRHEAMRKRGPR